MPVKRARKSKFASADARPSEGMGGLAKGLAIIEALATHGVQNSADAGRASHSTRAAARRCLLTLVELGYVERIGREFRPLPRLRNLGRGSNLRERLTEESRPILARGRDQLNESLSLAVPDGDSVLFIARAEAEQIISTGVRIGARLPAYCSATGRVLLSGLDDKEIRAIVGKKAFPQRTAKTLTKPADIVNEVLSVREAGYSVSDEEIEIGMRSLAVPVHDHDGKLVAAMSVSVYSARVSRQALIKILLPVVQECATQLEEACFGKCSGPKPQTPEASA
jgi:IclR family pca regulon transcriptional regulator